MNIRLGDHVHMTSAPRGEGGFKNCLILRTNCTDRLREIRTRGRGVSKIPKILRMSYVHGPSVNSVWTFCISAPGGHFCQIWCTLDFALILKPGNIFWWISPLGAEIQKVLTSSGRFNILKSATSGNFLGVWSCVYYQHNVHYFSNF